MAENTFCGFDMVGFNPLSRFHCFLDLDNKNNKNIFRTLEHLKSHVINS